MKIYYNQKLKILSRELRKNSTLSEVLLWNELKARKMKGYQFMRQKPIDDYIVDFYCSKLNLVIEIDGISHDSEKFEGDMIRQQKLESLGLYLLRFNDLEIKKISIMCLGLLNVGLKNMRRNNPLTPFIKGE